MLKLKKAKPATIEVSLPPEPFDTSLERDGVSEKPAESIGLRQWWLLQIVSFIPPAVWTTRWNLSPAQCIEAANDYADILVRGWTLAAKRTRDQAWIKAILASTIKRPEIAIDQELIKLLRRDDQREMIAGALDGRTADFAVLKQLLNGSDCELDRRSAMRAIDEIEAHVSSLTGAYYYELSSLLENLALRIPPEMHDELANRWADEQWQSNRKAIDGFFQTLIIRRDIKREFT
jgi:hypothetical protein